MGVRNPPRLADATDLDETGKAAGKVVGVATGDATYELVDAITVTGTPTDGQVPTSDGAGGIAWETPPTAAATSLFDGGIAAGYVLDGGAATVNFYGDAVDGGTA